MAPDNSARQRAARCAVARANLGGMVIKPSRFTRMSRAVTAGVVFTTALVAAVDAHDAHVAGPYRLAIGWADEPAFTGIRNAVFVEINEAGKGPRLSRHR